jgi:serine/threonine protein kinase
MSNTSLIGRVLGKYQITETLGRGGMAEVYKAYQESLDRYVAVKVMHSFLAEEQNFLTRFKREARAMAALNHNNIVVVHDFDVQDGLYYIAMEFVSGGTLKDRLAHLNDAGERLPLDQVVRLVLEVAAALTYAHERDMVHRDIKPGNIMLDSEGHAVLTDFGIAKIMSGPTVTATGAMIGTPAYMSPEQGLGRPGDERSDLYALGVLFYHMATGRLPYEADTPLAVVLKHVNEPVPEPDDLDGEMPKPIWDVIIKAMAKDPDDRFQTARELSAKLRTAATQSGMDLASLRPAAIMPEVSRVKSPPPVPPTQIHQVEPTMVAADASIGGRESSPLTAASATASAQVSQAAQTRVAPFETVDHTEVAMPVQPAPLPAREIAATADKRRLPVALLIAIIAVIVVVGGGFAAFTVLSGDDTPEPEPTQVAAVDTETPSPSDTPEPEDTLEPSPTADFQLTADAAVAIALTAAAGPPPTETPTPTPDLTATALANCVWDVELVSSYPYSSPNFTSAVAGRVFPMNWVLRNVGTCTIESGAEWVFQEGQAFGNPAPVVLEEDLAPGDEVTLTTNLTAPSQTGQAQSVWQLTDADGEAIGEPVTFQLSILAPTATRPAATPTPTVTPTPEGPVQALNFQQNVDTNSCEYQGSFWSCSLYVEPYGGRPPYVVLVAISDPPERYEGMGPFQVTMVSGRCNAWVHNIAVRDSAGQQVSRDIFYNPDNLFPGGCLLP